MLNFNLTPNLILNDNSIEIEFRGNKAKLYADGTVSSEEYGTFNSPSAFASKIAQHRMNGYGRIFDTKYKNYKTCNNLDGIPIDIYRYNNQDLYSNIQYIQNIAVRNYIDRLLNKERVRRVIINFVNAALNEEEMPVINKVKKFIELSKEYGKPSKSNIEYFVRSVCADLRIKQERNEFKYHWQSIDAYWHQLQADIKSDKYNKLSVVFTERGCFDFYDYLIKQNFDTNTTDDKIKQVIENYTDFEENSFEICNFEKQQSNINSTQIVDEAKHALKSDETEKSNKANCLTEQAKDEIYDDFKNRDKQLDSNLDYEYIIGKPYKNIELQYNTRFYTEINHILEKYATLYLIGDSRSGKTFILNKILGEKFNIDLSELELDTYKFENLLIIDSLMDKKDFRKVFAQFCLYNKNSDICYAVFNEASKDAFARIFPFWEQLDKDGITFEDRLNKGLTFNYNDTTIEIPHNLKIIVSIAYSQYDKQVANRLKNIVDLGDIKLQDAIEISAYTKIDEWIIKYLIEAQNHILKQHYNDINRRFIVPYHLANTNLVKLEEYNEIINRLCHSYEYNDAYIKVKEFINENRG